MSPSGLDDAEEFQVVVERGARGDLLHLALFIGIEGHLNGGRAGGWRWWKRLALSTEVGENDGMANHQDVCIYT